MKVIYFYLFLIFGTGEGFYFTGNGLYDRNFVPDLMNRFLPKINITDPLPIPNFGGSEFEYVWEHITVSGHLGVCDALLSGLSEIELYLFPRPANHTYVDVVFGIYSETIRFVGGHDLDLSITNGDDGGETIVAGSGDFDAETVGAKFVANFVVNVNPSSNKFKISNMSLHLGFDCLAINMEETTLNGEVMDWAEFSTQFKIDFDNFWEKIRPGFSKTVQILANYLTKECTTEDMMNLNTLQACIMETVNPEEEIESALAHLTGHFERNLDKSTCPQPSFLPNLKTPKRAVCNMTNDGDPNENTTQGSGASFNAFNFNVAAILFIISYNLH